MFKDCAIWIKVYIIMKGKYLEQDFEVTLIYSVLFILLLFLFLLLLLYHHHHYHNRRRLLVNKLSERSCACGMFHTKFISLAQVIPGPVRISLLCRIKAQNTFHFISFGFQSLERCDVNMARIQYFSSSVSMCSWILYYADTIFAVYLHPSSTVQF